ncbi:MerR family transcriptional regulator [Actinomadura sp. ATCC 31491]|uniref:MerR family transcriptional regulator n=1 Tax=Actinomadura luzonensis TaxID=2805427 RepID=A0ABT0G361_9ACTN|nr:MerR family transcriptional regulator [Actinomadura luzonensis]MCK2219010.1 MerR family transcriptional regulator [Actinomadura luzonensis]
MNARRWRIGELAAATGVTVRTLRHFDQIGLLRPAERSPAGHRVYTGDDVRRLYRILALRELRLPLAEIRRSLEAGADLRATLDRQLDQVERQLAGQHALRRRLLGLAAALDRAGRPSIDQLIDTMEAMMQARHFTPEQLARFEERHRELGQDGLARRMRELDGLAAEAREHAGRGTDPADPAVQDLARRWTAAVAGLAGGDRNAMSAIYGKIEARGPEAATKGMLSEDAWSLLRRAFAVGFPV